MDELLSQERHGCPMIHSTATTTTYQDMQKHSFDRPFPKRLRQVLSTNKTKRNAALLQSVANVAVAESKHSAVVQGNLLLDGLSSRPTPGGNWNPENPLEWAASFGSRSRKTWEQLKPLIHLKPGDEGYHYVPLDEQVEGVTVVRTKEHALEVLEILQQADPSVFHACDTEVMAIDLKREGPVGNGYVTCLSVYSGPDFDYGQGVGKRLWIDNLDDAQGILQTFKPWLENSLHRKVWHNYGFDRHVLWNEGIDVRGFGGDTMHMARLQDTSRAKNGGGYSLESLTNDLIGRRKTPMKELFGVKRKRKDGTDGLISDVPAVEVMQRDPQHRPAWIEYSAFDAEGTWLLREELQKRLENMSWCQGKNLYEYYEMHMRPFGEVLTDMERRGIRVDAKDYLAKVEVQAREDRAKHLATFRKWAESKIGPDGLALNPASSVQLTTFLFGGAENVKTREPTEEVRVFKTAREEISDAAMEAYRMRDEQWKAQKTPEEGTWRYVSVLLALTMLLPLTECVSFYLAEPEKDDLDHMTAVQLKALCKEHGLKVSGKKADLQERLRGHFLLSAQDDSPSKVGDDFEEMSDDDLRDACKTRGLQETGKRNQLLDRLRKDSSYSAELLAAMSPKDKNGYQIISKALEDAANGNSEIKDILSEIKQKSNAEPKYVDVTVRSIGMTPEKFTNGGAPSATADVLRKLAGDPFGDEPRFGTVSMCKVENDSLFRLRRANFALFPLIRPTISLVVETRDAKHVKPSSAFARSVRLIP